MQITRSVVITIAVVFVVALVGYLLFRQDVAAPPESREAASEGEQGGATSPERPTGASGGLREVSVQPARQEASEPDGPHVYGIVVDAESGSPIEGARVFVRDPGRSLPEEAVTKGDGSYTLPVRGDQGAVFCEAKGYVRTEQRTGGEVAGAVRVDFTLHSGGAIRGRVVDARSDAGIEEATVMAAAADQSMAQMLRFRHNPNVGAGRAETASDGSFLLEGLEPGAYRVMVSAREKGYLFDPSQAQTVRIEQGELVEDVQFQLEKGATITGRVVTAQGGVAPDARVMAMPGDMVSRTMRSMETMDLDALTPLSTPTDSEGRFTLSGLEYGTEYHVGAKAEGYAQGIAKPVTISRADPPATLEIVLGQGSTVAGIVQTPDGEPVADQRLLLMPGMEHMMVTPMLEPKQATSVQDGSFQFEHVAAGTYRIMPAGEHFAPGERSQNARDTFEVDGERDVSGLVVTTGSRDGTGEAGAITGTVLNAQGRPAGNAQVTVKPLFMPGGATTISTNPDGTFAFSELEGGMFTVTARLENAVAKAEGVGGGEDITLQLEQPAMVSGVVLTPQNQPAVNCELRLESLDPAGAPREQAEIMAVMQSLGNDRQHSAYTGPNGYFEFAEVQAGQYKIEARSRSEGFAESNPFPVHPGQDVENLSIKLEAGATFSGVVEDARGREVAGAMVKLIGVEEGEPGAREFMANMMQMVASQDTASATTDTNGRFSIENVAAGTYALEATHEDYAKTRVPGVVVEANRDVTNYRVRLTQGGTARGVYAPQGQPKPGTMIMFMGDQGTQFAMTDAQGRFALPNLPPGDYTAVPMDMEQMNPEDMLTLPNRAENVTIQDGEETELDFEPPEQGVQVQGTVSGNPGRVTLVSIRKPGGPGPRDIDPMNMQQTMQAMRYQVASGIVQPDGTFTLENVPSGEYIMDAVSIDMDLSNPNPMDLMNLADAPVVTREINVGEGSVQLDLEFPSNTN